MGYRSPLETRLAKKTTKAIVDYQHKQVAEACRARGWEFDDVPADVPLIPLMLSRPQTT